MERLHSGWLTKAPPESRMRGPWPFKSHWRRRFFVLYVPPSSSGCTFTTAAGHAFLDYYDSDRTTNKKGMIELKNCEEIQDHLDSPYYKYLFSLRTVGRTYYLAADSEMEMDAWVNRLSGIMGFNTIEQFAPITPPVVPVATNFVSMPVCSQIRQSPAMATPIAISAVAATVQPQHHTSDSPPLSVAPTPPQKPQRNLPPELQPSSNSASMMQDCDNVDDQPPALTPKRRQRSVDDFCDQVLSEPYNMQSCASGGRGIYDHPAVACSSLYQLPTSLMTTNDTDDDDDDAYDDPPSASNGFQQVAQAASVDEIYDFPMPQAQQQLWAPFCAAPPPPLTHVGPKVHQYINASSSVCEQPSDSICSLTDDGGPDYANINGDGSRDLTDFLHVTATLRTRSFKSNQKRSNSKATADAELKLPHQKPTAASVFDSGGNCDLETGRN